VTSAAAAATTIEFINKIQYDGLVPVSYRSTLARLTTTQMMFENLNRKLRRTSTMTTVKNF